MSKEPKISISILPIAEMELEVPGGMTTMIERITKTQDTPSLIKVFKELILRSYGKKSDDGRRFIKNKELVEEFKDSEAYSELFMELATNAEAASAFVNGITPKIPEAAKKIPAKAN